MTRIGLGEDGPTHQPVEHLAISRATPNTLVLRPADLVEVAECWEIAFSQKTTPSVHGAEPPEPGPGAQGAYRAEHVGQGRLCAGRGRR